MMSPEFIQQLMDAMIPSYENHISSEDLQQVLEFYSSPSGQRMLEAQPAMMAEGIAAAMPLMRSHLQELMKDEQTRIAAYKANNDKVSGK